MGKLEVRIVSCSNLANTETFGTSDPYCTVSCEGRKYRTTTIKNDLNPRWDEKFSFMIADPASERLHFEVKDHNKVMSDDNMGHYYMGLAGLIQGQVKEEEFILNGCKKGTITVRVMAVDFSSETPPPVSGSPSPPLMPLPVPVVCDTEKYQQPSVGYYPPLPIPDNRTNYKNEDIQSKSIKNATINTCDIIDCLLENCQIRQADLKGNNVLRNCTVREIDIYGVVTLESGGRFECGTLKSGGQLITSGDTYINDIDNYHGH